MDKVTTQNILRCHSVVKSAHNVYSQLQRAFTTFRMFCFGQGPAAMQPLLNFPGFLFLILQICLQVHINAQNILLFHINSLSDALELESLGDLLYTTMIDKICLALQTNWFTKQENRQTHILLRQKLAHFVGT